MRPSRLRFLLALPFLLSLVVGVLCSASAAFAAGDQLDEDPFGMSLQNLLNVSISTADRSEQTVAEIPASVVIVTREDIQRHGYATLFEVLQSIPGLYGINDYSSLGPSFGVRGFWSSQGNAQIAILVNGVRQVYDYVNSSPLVRIAVPVDAIDRIEVVRGPLSVIYGSGAFFGAINIITNEIPDHSTRHEFSVAIGSAETRLVSACLGAREGNLAGVVRASYYDTRGIDRSLSDLTNDPGAMAAYGIPQDYRTGGRLAAREKRVHFSGEMAEFRAELSLTEHEGRSMFLAPSPTDGSFMRMTATDFALAWRRDLSERFTGEARLTWSRSRFTGDVDLLHADFHGFQQHECSAVELDLNAFWNVSKELDFRAGFNQRSVPDLYNYFDIASLGQPAVTNNLHTIDADDDIVTRAVFAQIDYQFAPGWRLVAGGRLEKMLDYGIGMDLAAGTPDFEHFDGRYEGGKVEAVPRLALLATLHPRHVIKLLYGEATTRPGFFAITRNSLDPSLPDLAPEKIRTAELNYVSSGPAFSINASLFRNELDNLITRLVEYDDEGGYSTWSANAGEMTTLGAEVTVEGTLSSRVSWQLSGIVQDTENDCCPEREVAYSPPILGYARLLLGIREGSTLALDANYIGEMQSYWDETRDNGDGTSGARIGDEVSSYCFLGANLRVESLFVDDLSCSLRCWNLLDTDIRYPTFTNNSWADRGTLDHGRSVMLKFSLAY